MPRWIIYSLLVAVVLSWVPLAIIANARSQRGPKTRIQIFQDMGIQPKLKTQERSGLFNDHRAMRLPVAGTVARGELGGDASLMTGRAEGQFVTRLPKGVEVNLATLKRGQERFNIYCGACHGLVGEGNGAVALRAQALQEAKFIPPTNIQSDTIRVQPVGQIFHTITYGVRSMPPYGPQIGVEDRWAIVGYVKALQLSQSAKLEDVPVDQREGLEAIK